MNSGLGVPIWDSSARDSTDWDSSDRKSSDWDSSSHRSGRDGLCHNRQNRIQTPASNREEEGTYISYDKLVTSHSVTSFV